MLAKTKLEKLANDLNSCNAKVRNLSLDEAKVAIERAEAEVKTLAPELRTMVTYEYSPHSVANAYSYRAKGTGIEVKFNARGKAIKATAHRLDVGTTPVEALFIDGIDDFVSSEYGIAKPEWDAPERKNFDGLIAFIEKMAGFRHGRKNF